MTIIFWGSLAFLYALALGFILPFLPEKKWRTLSIMSVALISFSLYFKLGSSERLKEYFSEAGKLTRRIYVNNLQPNLIKLRREKFRLIQALDAGEPKEMIEWRLWEIEGIEFLLQNEARQAENAWRQALQKMPKTADMAPHRKHLTQAIANLKQTSAPMLKEQNK